MKILIGSLLFATAIFINFPELNSSPRPSGAGSSRRNVIVRPRQPRGRDPPTYMREIHVLNKKIEVYMEKIDDDKYVAYECNLFHTRTNIPNASNKGKSNFITQPVFTDYKGSIIKIVIYIRVEVDNSKTLVGAKLPPKEDEVFAPGDPLGLDPDESKYFFTHRGIDYVVDYDAESDSAIDIKLWGHSNIRPNHEEIKNNWPTYHYFKFNDIYVLLFLNLNKEIEGVAMDPHWTYRPGERDAHLNPYAEFQEAHGINIQQHYELAADTTPHENVHQNPIITPHHNQHYPHLNYYLPAPFDPSHHHAQQSIYPPPHFDSSQYHGQHSGTSPLHFDTSQYYGQPSGTSLPHFDPNANWNIPPHYPPNP